MLRLAESVTKLEWPWLVVQDIYLQAWEFRPTRAEALYALARRYREDERYLPGHLFAQRAAQIPFPENDLLFIGADIYAWRAIDEQAVCASQLGNHAEAFGLCRRLLARPDIPDADRQRIAVNRDVSVPVMLEATSSYPDALVQRLVAGPGATVVVSLVAGPDRETTEQSINSFLNCCLDLPLWFGRFLVLDTGLSAPDRLMLQQRYGFLEFVDCSPDDAPAAQLAQLRAQIQGRFWLHLGQGWRFFAPENFITRLIAVLESEPQVFQVGINFADAVKLTGVCAAEQEVRRTPDAGRYVLTDAVASGPAMFDTARLDRAGSIGGSDPDPIAELGWRAVAVGLRTASLDEVLCIAAVRPRAATQSPRTGREEGRSPTRKATQSPRTGLEKGRSPTRKATQSPRHESRKRPQPHPQSNPKPPHGSPRRPQPHPQSNPKPPHGSPRRPQPHPQSNPKPPHGSPRRPQPHPQSNPKPPHGSPRRPQPHPQSNPKPPHGSPRRPQPHPQSNPKPPHGSPRRPQPHPQSNPKPRARVAKKAAVRPMQQPKAPARVAKKGRRPKTPPQ